MAETPSFETKDRMATIEDPFGHKWTVATHKEDVPPDELARRAAALHNKK